MDLPVPNINNYNNENKTLSFPTEDSSFQSQPTQDLGPLMNVEGISQYKREYLAKLAQENNFSFLLIQEKNTANINKLLQRLSIFRFLRVAVTYSKR